MSDIATAARLMDACEQVLCEAEHLDDATVRKVVSRAGTNVSAINYHFGAHEKLIFAVAERVYHRLNAQRLTLLQTAIDRGRPGPPALEELVGALIGPSIRWSLDPTSSYPVLAHVTTMMQRGKDPELYRTMRASSIIAPSCRICAAPRPGSTTARLAGASAVRLESGRRSSATGRAPRC